VYATTLSFFLLRWGLKNFLAWAGLCLLSVGITCICHHAQLADNLDLDLLISESHIIWDDMHVQLLVEIGSYEVFAWAGLKP
jgi:hypothetical protein